jgi:outer membrane biosynthesis protein TonB
MNTRIIAILGSVGLALVMAVHPQQNAEAKKCYDQNKEQIPCPKSDYLLKQQSQQDATATESPTPTDTPKPTATKTPTPTPTDTPKAQPPPAVEAPPAAAAPAAGASAAIPPTNTAGTAFLLIVLGGGVLVGGVLIGFIVRLYLARHSGRVDSPDNPAELYIEPERDEVP